MFFYVRYNSFGIGASGEYHRFIASDAVFAYTGITIISPYAATDKSVVVTHIWRFEKYQKWMSAFKYDKTALFSIRSAASISTR